MKYIALFSVLLASAIISCISSAPVSDLIDNYSGMESVVTVPYLDETEVTTSSDESEILPIQYKWKKTPNIATQTNTGTQTRNNNNGFWPLHSSDLLPMRRPPGVSSTSPYKKHILSSFGIGRRSVPITNANTDKRSVNVSFESPYHPLPRSVAQRNKNHEELNAIAEQLAEEGETLSLQKRQSPGSYLLLKLSRLNRPPPKNKSDNNRPDPMI